MSTTTAACSGPLATVPARTPRAEQVMVRRPRTLPADGCVDDVRAQLADDHVHMVLLVDGDVLVGTIVRGDVPADADPAAHARRWSTLEDRTTGPEAPADVLRAGMVDHRRRRLAVVGERGRLLGLLCLKRTGDGFCSDADVTARAGDRGARG